MWAARQPHRRRGGGGAGSSGARLTLALACLLALSRGTSGQAIFDLLTAPTAPTTTVTPVASPAPTNPTTTVTPVASPAPTTTTTTPADSTTPTTTVTPVASPAPTTPTTTTTPVASPAPITPTTTTASPAPTTTTTTTPAPAATPSTAPVASPPAAAPSTSVPAPNTTIPTTTNATVATNVTSGTPPVSMPPGSDATPVTAVGTVGSAPAPPTDVLPPAPPEGWQALQKDCQIVFIMEIRGPYIVPFTSPKAHVIARVLRDRYLRSAQLPDISVAALRTFTYWSYDSPEESADPVATGSRRRLFSSRDLLQMEKSGAELKVVVATNQVRVPSEIESIEDGVANGTMADDFTIAHILTDNLTLVLAPMVEDLIGPGTQEGSGEGGMKVWMVALIVGAILLVLPAPLYMLVRWKRRRSKEAAAVAEAEAEAARQRMQSRVMRPGSKSFSLKPGGSSADIMVMSGSMGGLVGFNNNGRLQSWSGSPERQYGQQYAAQQYAISRATSVTSMGSGMPSARMPSYAMPQHAPSLPGQPRGPYQQPGGPMVPPPGAFEEELVTARSHRSMTSNHSMMGHH